MRIHAVFLDVDGVINDHALNPGMWVDHIGEVLAPALGGTPEDWGRANRVVFPRVWAMQHTWGTDPIERIRREAVGSIGGMARELGLAPPSADRCFELMREIDVHIGGTAEAAFPWAAAAIRELAAMGPVHTATGNPSWRVEALLRGLDVRDLVGIPAGPDLVGIAKSERLFYERVFECAEVDPATALVVDDTADCIVLAGAAGARAVHLSADGCDCPADSHLPSLAGVPGLLASSAAPLG